VAFACRYALKKPILFFGVGEKVADLEYFYPDRIAGRMLGMGDVLSLAEKADAVIKKDEQEAANRALSSGRLTLNDFIAQCEMLNRLGSFSQIVKYIPGLGGHKITPEMIERGERELNQFKAIIQSMTLKERLNHRILDGSRKRRVAGGAGVTVEQVNRMLTRFEEIQQSAKLFAKLGKFPGLFK
jgi:signal recognition particle subunit SRP54